MKKVQCILLAMLLLVQSAAVAAVPAAADTAPSPAVTQPDASSGDSSSDGSLQVDYRTYRRQHETAAYPTDPVAARPEQSTGEDVVLEAGHADAAIAVRVSEKHAVTMPVTVPATGWYQLRLTYEAVVGKGAEIQFALAIDGAYPFTESQGILLSRTYVEQMPEGADENDDTIRPMQVQTAQPQTVVISAGDSFTDEKSYYYFTAGEHTLTLLSDRGEFWVGALTLCQPRTAPTYEEYLSEHAAAGRTPVAVDAPIQYLEGEEAVLKSDAAVKSVADYSSCLTRPYSVTRDLLNTFGGENWATSGQWAEWEFTTDTPGFYQLFFRYKQNYKSGTYVVRSLTVDGETPFRESAYITFAYDLGWCVSTLGGDQPMYIYLSEGTHTLRMEVAYGVLGEVLTEVQSCLDVMNVLYRNVMMITGASPDSLRDYGIAEALPDCAATCDQLSRRLYAVVDTLAAQTGGKGSETAVLEKTAMQLKEIAKDVELLPQRLSAYNSNISGIASWLITAKNQPLLIDYMAFAPVGTPAPRAEAVWYRQIWNELQRFFVTFFEDYDNINTAHNSDETPVTIWLGTGRDQALAIQSLVRNGFTASTGIPVNLRLIALDSLMRAVASNSGPDVAMFQDQATVINYALRNAVYDLNQFKDIDEVKSQFYPESLRCYMLDGAQYGIPESISCYVMYYRKDILGELNLTPPDTWDDLYKVLTVLEKNHLEFGAPSTFTTATTTALSPLFLTMLYQMGGEVYDAQNRYCILNNEVGVKAFTAFSELYTKYGLSLKIDLLTRFRTGEAPLLITDFTFGSQLAVSAPEISGLWDTVLLPGTVQEDGSINRSTLMSNGGVIMFNNARDVDNAWEYIKWWTGAQAQQDYAQAIEATLGKSGRWNSANIEAFSNSGWSSAELAVFQEQLSYAKAIPEVPGGYYTGRSINNAIRTVVTANQEPKETLYEYVTDVNKEIRQKRREFGMDL